MPSLQDMAWDCDEYSRANTSGESNSDKESDYLTGLEDFGDSSSKTAASKPKDILLFLSDPSRTSSFIHSILYEDSCAEVAVVDLFVAVKAVKDKMDFLSKFNNEVLCKITDLNTETIAIRAGYRNLRQSMLMFLERINETELGDQLRGDASSTSSPGQRRLVMDEGGRSSDNRCHCCGRGDRPYGPCLVGSAGEAERRGSCVCSQYGKGVEARKADCLSCLLSMFRERGQPPILNEALLGSFIASLLWLQKREGGLCHPCQRSNIKSQGQEGKMPGEKGLDLSDSNIQMICDICEILSGTPPQCLGPLTLSKRIDSCEEPHGSTWALSNHNCTAQAPNGRLHREENRTTRPRSRDSSRSKEDAISDGESIFEEALTDLATPSLPLGLPGRHNVTCMGDLSSEMSGKKNVSTFTASSDMASSWVGKLTEDIKTKLKKIKSKANVTVVERPYEKSRKTLQRLVGALEFAITANTPMGVFDVTVLQYRKCRRSNEPEIGRSVEIVDSRESAKNRCGDIGTADVTDFEHSLEKKIENSESESGEGSSESGEDEMEEFLEIYVDNSNRSDQPVAPPRQKAISKTAVSKLPKSPFFEIHKRYPMFFVLEILQKKPILVQPKPSPGRNSYIDKEVVSLNTGERQKQEVVIRRSSSDLVIYIQVEVEDGQQPSSGGLLVEYQTTSHGTQTKDIGESFRAVEENVIKLEEEQQDGESLYHIWRGYEMESLGEAEERERITFDEQMMIIGEQEAELKEEDEERVVMVKEPMEKMVTFSEVLSETFEEAEVQETWAKEAEEGAPGRGSATIVTMLNAKLHVDIWLPQNELVALHRMEMVDAAWENRQQPLDAMFVKAVTFSNIELEKALNLVHEIENDVMDVKLSDAISILPQLESELRKHLHNKMKHIGEKDLERDCSVDNFFSAVDFWPDEESTSNIVDSIDSNERLNNLMKLLSDLEGAVRSNDYSAHGVSLCECNSSRICKLLHALTTSIRKLEETPTVMSLSQTLDIASQLDTAVREYDSIIKRQPLDYVSPEKEDTRPRLKSRSLEDGLAKQHLKGIRKKVFEIVEEEAIDMEGRIERDFDRLDRLEIENDEAMKFLEAFLQKTERRATELDHLKDDLDDLASSMGKMYENVVKVRVEREKKLTSTSRDVHPRINEPVRETISGLLIALDSLKSRAREKNEVCREILSSVGFPQGVDSEKSSRRSSRSSFTAKQVETMTSTVKEFKKIGRSSLYLSWTKPEGSPSVSVVGYEIHVNGMLNQKVRNPARLQAVLYSVDLKKETEVHLYALVDSGPKILLAAVAYLDV